MTCCEFIGGSATVFVELRQPHDFHSNRRTCIRTCLPSIFSLFLPGYRVFSFQMTEDEAPKTYNYTYKDFETAHQAQLIAADVPSTLWPYIFSKLANEVFHFHSIARIHLDMML